MADKPVQKRMIRVNKDTAPIIAAEYVLTGYDKVQTLLNCGYTPIYARSSNGKTVFKNVLVRAAIDQIEARRKLVADFTLKDIQAKHIDALSRLITKDETNYYKHLMALGSTIAAYKSVELSVDFGAPRPSDDADAIQAIKDSVSKRLGFRAAALEAAQQPTVDSDSQGDSDETELTQSKQQSSQDAQQPSCKETEQLSGEVQGDQVNEADM